MRMMPGDPSDGVLRRRSFLQLAVLAGGAVAVPAAVCRLLPDETMDDGEFSELDIDPDGKRRELARSKADWVLIGNSMLNSRVNRLHLEAISGHRVRRVSLGGTQAALWWLFFKNIVIGSGHHPAWVTFFFRESDLSWPEFRITGNNGRLIRKTRTASEPEWDEVIGWREPARGPVAALAGRVFPVGERGDRSRRKLAETAMSVTNIGNLPHGNRRVQLNELFSLDHLRRDLGDDGTASQAAAAKVSLTDLAHMAGLPDPGMYDAAPTTFDPSPRASFLPHTVALAKARGVRLHFHRVKRRPLADGTRPDLPAMARYLVELETWLRGQGCAYSDEIGRSRSH